MSNFEEQDPVKVFEEEEEVEEKAQSNYESRQSQNNEFGLPTIKPR